MCCTWSVAASRVMRANNRDLLATTDSYEDDLELCWIGNTPYVGQGVAAMEYHGMCTCGARQRVPEWTPPCAKPGTVYYIRSV